MYIQKCANSYRMRFEFKGKQDNLVIMKEIIYLLLVCLFLQEIPNIEGLLDRVNKKKQHALLQACRFENFDAALKMVEAGANVDISDQNGHPIHYAVYHGNIQ